MNKRKFLYLFLILLPVTAGVLATTMDSVMVFDSGTGALSYYSYFALIPGMELALVLPLAAIGCVLCAILAIAALVMKREGWVATVKWLSLVCATLAVLPVLARGERLIVPNVLLPLLMLGEFAVAFFLGRKAQTPEKKGTRLEKR